MKKYSGSKIINCSVKLHPTFQPSVISINPPNLILNRVGWGTFEIKIQINLKDGNVMMKHQLQFVDTCFEYFAI